MSENVSLFQSLRVLQEGETDGSELYSNDRNQEQANHQTCLKTSTLSAITVSVSIILCFLSASVVIACAQLRYRNKETSLYETYITHKGQID